MVSLRTHASLQKHSTLYVHNCKLQAQHMQLQDGAAKVT